jgi:DNA-binding transcriptional regulator LsrR (DeoR family)
MHLRIVSLHLTGLKNNEIATEVGLHRSNVSRHLAAARQEGLLPDEGSAT